MALLTLFVMGGDRPRLAAMELDCVISEDHNLTAQISRSEVEEGGDITDNVVLDPRSLTIEGVVSKTPIGKAALAASLATAAAGQVGQGGGITNTLAFTGAASLGGLVTAGLLSDFDGDGEDKPKSREPSDVFAYMEQLYEKRITFEVQTGLRLYENMIFSSLKIPRNSKTTNILQFKAVLNQIRVVSSKAGTATLPLPVAGAVADGAKKKAGLGTQAASEASKKVSDDSTVAFKVFGGALK